MAELEVVEVEAEEMVGGEGEVEAAVESWKVTEAVVELGEAVARQLQMASRDSENCANIARYSFWRKRAEEWHERRGSGCVLRRVRVELATPV